MIKIPITKLEALKDNKIAHLSFYSFASTAPFEFQQAASKILATTGYKGIILDLRNNPGGFLEVSVDIAGWFLDAGNLVAIEQFGKTENNNKTEFRTSGLGALKNYPMSPFTTLKDNKEFIEWLNKNLEEYKNENKFG